MANCGVSIVLFSAWISGLFASTLRYDCPLIVSREQWGAKPPKPGESALKRPTPYLVVHHTDFERCFNFTQCVMAMKRVQDFHQITRNWTDIGYQFLVGEDGRVYEGRDFRMQGAQDLHWNQVSIGIAMMGDFSKAKPQSNAIDALKDIIYCSIGRGIVSKDAVILGHRQTQRPGYTTCPGDQLICAISTFPRWKAAQANGTFVMPACKSPLEEKSLWNAILKMF